MKLDFLIIQRGHPLFQNQQETATYEQLQQRKLNSVKQLQVARLSDSTIDSTIGSDRIQH
jgi:hypothetical protein